MKVVEAIRLRYLSMFPVRLMLYSFIISSYISRINLFSAPPAFIQNLNPYEGILSTSKHINLTCRVECSPICSITWFKDNRLIDVNANPLYTAKTEILQPDLQKNDFESIKSTLVILKLTLYIYIS